MTNARLTAKAGLAMRSMSLADGANEMGAGLPNANAATMNTTISATLMKVDTFWNVLARWMPQQVDQATSTTPPPAPAAQRGAPGTTPAK